MKELCHLPRKILPQAYQTSQYMVLRSGIFLGKWHSTFTGNSDGKMNALSACTLNTLYKIHLSPSLFTYTFCQLQ
jgi:hypothetical protein